jgi:hypothetical protein
VQLQRRSFNDVPVNESDKVGCSFESGSCVTDASDLPPEKQLSQITSTDEGM